MRFQNGGHRNSALTGFAWRKWIQKTGSKVRPHSYHFSQLYPYEDSPRSPGVINSTTENIYENSLVILPFLDITLYHPNLHHVKISNFHFLIRLILAFFEFWKIWGIFEVSWTLKFSTILNFSEFYNFEFFQDLNITLYIILNTQHTCL